MTLATDERAAICDAFDLAGPDRPTLCIGWNTSDLLAHLLVRERQTWMNAGVLMPALAPITEHAMRGYAQTPWPDRVDLLRNGAPLWSPWRLGPLDRFGNAAEFFVHHEDVRRGEPGWEPRPAEPARDAQLWALLARMGRILYRSSPVGIVLRRPSGGEQVVRTGPGVVTVVGEPAELVLHAFGRDAVRIELQGAPADVDKLAGSSRGM